MRSEPREYLFPAKPVSSRPGIPCHYIVTTAILYISIRQQLHGNFPSVQQQHCRKILDLLYNARNRHLDVIVITSRRGLFDARHYCYSCHCVFSTIKHLCSASMYMLCRQSDCLNRTVFINTSASIVSGTLLFQSDRCHLKLRKLNCSQCHIRSAVSLVHPMSLVQQHCSQTSLFQPLLFKKALQHRF